MPARVEQGSDPKHWLLVSQSGGHDREVRPTSTTCLGALAPDTEYRIGPARPALKDFFELFGTFKGFVELFHFQDLIAPGSDYQEIEYFLEPNGFTRSGTPATKDEYVEYRENVLAFIKKRGERMAKWVMENHRDIEVIQ